MAREDLEPWVEIELAMTVLNFCLGKNGRKNGFAFFKYMNSTNLQNFYILIQKRALSVAVRLNQPICLSQSLAKQRHIPRGQEIDFRDFFPVSNEFSTLKKVWDAPYSPSTWASLRSNDKENSFEIKWKALSNNLETSGRGKHHAPELPGSWQNKQNKNSLFYQESKNSGFMLSQPLDPVESMPALNY